MKIQICSRMMAERYLAQNEREKFIPWEELMVIGALNSEFSFPIGLKSPEKRAYLTYLFDNIQEPYKDYILFSPEQASKLLKDFERESKGRKTLLVHCMDGTSRAPAVGSALNDVFNLGMDCSYFAQFWNMNPHIYRTLIREGEKWKKQN